MNLSALINPLPQVDEEEVPLSRKQRRIIRADRTRRIKKSRRTQVRRNKANLEEFLLAEHRQAHPHLYPAGVAE